MKIFDEGESKFDHLLNIILIIQRLNISEMGLLLKLTTLAKSKKEI